MLKHCWPIFRSLVKPRVLQALEKNGSDKDDDDNDEQEGNSNSEEKKSQVGKVVNFITLYRTELQHVTGMHSVI